MQAKSTRIAYLKRMLRRLEGEQTRLDELTRANELTSDGAKLAALQLSKERERLLAELRSLEVEDSHQGC